MVTVPRLCCWRLDGVLVREGNRFFQLLVELDLRLFDLARPLDVLLGGLE